MDRMGTGLKYLFVALLAVALLSAACNADKKKLDPPKFYVRDTAVNVGEIFEGKNITYSYKVRNNGVGELHIVNVRPG